MKDLGLSIYYDFFYGHNVSESIRKQVEIYVFLNGNNNPSFSLWGLTIGYEAVCLSIMGLAYYCWIHYW